MAHNILGRREARNAKSHGGTCREVTAEPHRLLGSQQYHSLTATLGKSRQLSVPGLLPSNPTPAQETSLPYSVMAASQ